jgi:DNA topoisomerase VI subunit B
MAMATRINVRYKKGNPDAYKTLLQRMGPKPQERRPNPKGITCDQAIIKVL